VAVAGFARTSQTGQAVAGIVVAVLGNRREGVPAEGGNLLAVAGGSLLAAVGGWGRGRTRWGRSAVVVVLFPFFSKWFLQSKMYLKIY